MECHPGATGGFWTEPLITFAVPIPKEQIETLQTIIREKVCFSPHPFLNVGRKVRIRGGSLDGICGILSAIYDNQSLIVSVDSIQRSLALQIDGYGIEPI